MPNIKLSRKSIADLAVPDKPVTWWDTDLSGFGLAIRPTGSRSWVVQYRTGAGGRGATLRRIVIGDPESVTPEDARREAKEVLAKARLGQDVAAERAEERKAETVAEIAEAWMTRHVMPKRKPATAKLYRAVLDTHLLPVLGTRRATGVTRSELARLHGAIAGKSKGPKKPGAKRTAALKARGGPTIANRALAVARAMFGWSIDMGLLPEGTQNPAMKIEAFRERARETFLDDAQMQALGAALRQAETIGLPWTVDASAPGAKHLPKPENRFARFDVHSVAAIRLLLLTGARVREVLDLRWADVDWQRGVLRLEDSKTGRKVIFLGAAALALLEALPKVGRYVIASTSAGTADEKPRADVNRLWRAVCKAAGLDGVRLHDLRHSAAAVAAGHGVSLHMIGGLLGHSQPSTTQRYAHLASDPMHRAADLIGGTVAAALGLGGNVVPIERGRQA